MINKLLLNTISEKSETIVLTKDNTTSNFDDFLNIQFVSSDYYAVYDNGVSKAKILSGQDYIDTNKNDLDSKLYVISNSVLKLTTNNSFIFSLDKLSALNKLQELVLLENSSGGLTSGDIKDLPSSLTKIEIVNNNNLSLNVEDIPYNCRSFKINGTGDFSTYNRRSWITQMKTLSIKTTGGSGMSENDVTNLLEDLSETTWQVNGLVEILGNHDSLATPTMQPFIDELESKGVTVNLNQFISFD